MAVAPALASAAPESQLAPQPSDLVLDGQVPTGLPFSAGVIIGWFTRLSVSRCRLAMGAVCQKRSLTPLHLHRLSLQAQTGSYLALLDEFFEGPSFDPTFNGTLTVETVVPIAGGNNRYAASSGDEVDGDDAPEWVAGFHSLPARLSIPVVVTGEDDAEYETRLVSPQKRMSMHPEGLSKSMPDSPTKYLPLWTSTEYSEDFDDYEWDGEEE